MSATPPDPARSVADGVLGLPALATGGGPFVGAGTFVGVNCTARERVRNGGSIVLAATSSEAWSPTFAGLDLTAAPAIEVSGALWVYILPSGALTAADAETLLATSSLWQASGRTELGFDGVPAGGGLFVYGSCAPPAAIGSALGITIPSQPLAGAITFPGGLAVATLRIPLDLPGITDPVLELRSPLGLAMGGLEIGLGGSISIDGSDIALWLEIPLGGGELTGEAVLTPSGDLGGLLPFSIPEGTEIMAEIAMSTAGGLALERVSFGLTLGTIALVDRILVLDSVDLAVTRIGGASGAFTVASLDAVATFGTARPAVFECRGSAPPGHLSLGLADGSVLDPKAALGDLGLGDAAAALPDLTVSTAELAYDAATGVGVELGVTCDWTLGPFTLNTLILSAGGGAISLATAASLGSGPSRIDFTLAGSHSAAGWSLTAQAVTSGTLGDALAGIASVLGAGDLGIPSVLQEIRLDSLMLAVTPKSVAVDARLELGGAPTEVRVNAALDAHDTWSATASGTVTVGGKTFELDLSEGAAGETLKATYTHAANDALDLIAFAKELGFDATSVLPSIELDTAELAYAAPADGSSSLVIHASTGSFAGTLVRAVPPGGGDAVVAGSFVLTLGVGVASIPAFGAQLAHLTGGAAITDIRLRGASPALAGPDLARVETAVRATTGAPLTEATTLDTLELSADLVLSGETVSLPLLGGSAPAAGSSTAGARAPAAAASQPGATASAATTDLVASPPASSSDPTVWVQVGRTIGPLHIERIGARFASGHIWVVIDAGLVLSAVEIDLVGLGIGFSLALPPDVTPALDGLAVSAPNAPVAVSGGLARTVLGGHDEFDGRLSIRAADWELSALGSYTTIDGTPSLFAFAVLDAELGGPPFFFLTGVAAGFGVNRDLVMPTIDGVGTFPLVQAVMGTAGPKAGSTVPDAISAMGQAIPPFAGENWVAAGLRFTSCRLVESVALLAVRFGQVQEIDLLGKSVLVVPPQASSPIAYAELDILGSYRPDRGVLSVTGQLTSASYILASDCRLTGGFAFCSWQKDQTPDRHGQAATAGDFVITLGGYHPDFAVPSYYPSVPRLGATWQSGDLVLKGQYYFALTPHAVMGGGAIEASWDSGPVSAWFHARADFLLCWKPFHYEASVSVEIGVSVEVDLLFTSFTVSASLGVDLEFHGPPFGGHARVDLYICSFTISFGADPPSRGWISWSAFRDSFLPAGDDGVCGAQVTGGLLKGRIDTPSGTYDAIVQPEGFEVSTFSAIPVDVAMLNDAPLALIAGAAAATSVGVGPVGLGSDEVTFTHSISLLYQGEPVDTPFLAEPVLTNVPAAAWSLDAAQAADRADMSALRGVAAVIAGAHTGFRLRPLIQPPDVTCQVDLDRLVSEDAPTERDFTWSGTAPATTRYVATDPSAQLEQDLVPGALAATVRDAILTALKADGVVAAELTIDLHALASAATNVLLAGPVLSSLGAPA